MKQIRTWHIGRAVRVWIIVSMLLIPYSILQAQVLYEISGNGCHGKSYLLATNRYVDMTFADTIPNAFKCFARCNRVVTEFTMQDYEAIAVLRQAALLPDSVLLKDQYTAMQYNEIDNALFLETGIHLDDVCRMKPSYLTELYRNELMKKWVGYDEQRSLETFFELVALERNIPIVGLDEIGETMYMLFDREPMSWQCEQLTQIINYPERDINLERTIREMYLMGRLTEIAYAIESPDNKATVSYSDYQVWAKRNKQWVKRLRPFLVEGRSFITLNAIYLGGEKGLINQLKSAGYRVRRVNRLRHYSSAS